MSGWHPPINPNSSPRPHRRPPAELRLGLIRPINSLPLRSLPRRPSLNDQPTTPHVRATIHGDTVTLTPWGPVLKPDPSIDQPSDDQPEAPVIIDLEYIGEAGSREVIVCGPASEPLPEQARAALIDWASSVGLARIWLPDQVIDLPDEVAADQLAVVSCPTCLTEFRCGGMTFWKGVRQYAIFPTGCRVCGATLPQWTLEAQGEKS